MEKILVAAVWRDHCVHLLSKFSTSVRPIPFLPSAGPLLWAEPYSSLTSAVTVGSVWSLCLQPLQLPLTVCLVASQAIWLLESPNKIIALTCVVPVVPRACSQGHKRPSVSRPHPLPQPLPFFLLLS